ncbi:hypothetical protein PTKIN_Ptkin09bG0184900 [Pterospermum kingtungense]
MRKKQGNPDQKKPDTNGVVITVYVESTSRDIRPLSESNPPADETNPVSKRSQGYDRRAQILAYSRELRTADNYEQIRWNETSSRHKSKAKVLEMPNYTNKNWDFVSGNFSKDKTAMEVSKNGIGEE